MRLWSKRCFIVASCKDQHLSVEKIQKKKNKMCSIKSLIRPTFERNGFSPDSFALEVLHDGEFSERKIIDHLARKRSMIRPICDRIIYDQTQLRSNLSWSVPVALKAVHHQIQSRFVMAKHKLTLNRFWRESSALEIVWTEDDSIYSLKFKY